MDDVVKAAGTWLAVFVIFALAPAPTNPLCYNSASYRDTHEQECIIDRIPGAGSTPTRGGHGGGLLGGLLGGLTGGLL